MISCSDGNSYFAFEFLHPFNVRPFEVIEDTGAMEEHVASVIEESRCAIWLGLLELDQPFTSILLPIRPNDFRAEVHVFSKAPDFADLIQVLPNVR